MGSDFSQNPSSVLGTAWEFLLQPVVSRDDLITDMKDSKVFINRHLQKFQVCGVTFSKDSLACEDVDMKLSVRALHLPYTPVTRSMAVTVVTVVPQEFGVTVLMATIVRELLPTRTCKIAGRDSYLQSNFCQE